MTLKTEKTHDPCVCMFEACEDCVCLQTVVIDVSSLLVMSLSSAIDYRDGIANLCSNTAVFTQAFSDLKSNKTGFIFSLFSSMCLQSDWDIYRSYKNFSLSSVLFTHSHLFSLPLHHFCLLWMLFSLSLPYHVFISRSLFALFMFSMSLDFIQ